MYNLVRYLGWAVVILYVLSVERYYLRKDPFLKMEALKPLRMALTKAHKPLGVLTLLIALTHAGMAFNNISKSITGTLTFLTMLVVVVFGVLLNMKKISADKVKIHRVIAISIPVLIILHIIFPYVFI